MVWQNNKQEAKLGDRGMQSTTKIDASLKEYATQKIQADILEGAMGAFKSGNTIIAAGLGIGAAAIAGTVFATNEYNEHKKKSHLRQIKEIEAIRGRRLKLILPGTTQEIPLCCIFQFDKDNPDKAKSSSFSKEELLQLVNARAPIDIALSTYSDAITSAMQQIYAFYLARLERKNYFKRGTEDDITSAVLRYLIRMLHDYGKKFEGYSRSILILNGIQGFINEFSLLHNENSERHSRLQSVCNKISEAITELSQHSKKLSLDELIGEAWPDCDEVTRKMMINFTKLITPTDQWTYIDRAWDPLLISQGIIQPEFEDGHWGTHRRAVFLLVSAFSDNLKKISTNFYKAKSNQDLFSESIEEGDEHNLKINGFTEKQKIKSYEVLQEACHNFITMTAKLKKSYSANAALIPISDPIQLEQRAGLLHDFSNLINQMVSCIKLFFRLSKYSKAMGELFVTNPNNGQFIFDVLLALGELVGNNINSLEFEFTKISEGFKNASLAPAQRDLLDDIKQNLVTARTQLGASIERILKHRNIINYTQVKTQINLDDHTLLAIAHNVALTHGIDHGHRILGHKPVENQNHNSHENISADEEKYPASSPQSNPSPPPIENHFIAPAIVSIGNIDDKFKTINEKLMTLPSDNVRAPYVSILNALTQLRNKAQEMQEEPTLTRKTKAIKIKELTFNSANQLLTLLNENNPKLNTLQKMLSDIRSPSNILIDEHNTFYGRFFNFNTASRKKVNKLAESCESMIKSKFSFSLDR